MAERVETKIEGLVAIEPQVFGDERGFLIESFSRRCVARLRRRRRRVRPGEPLALDPEGAARTPLPDLARAGQARPLPCVARSSTSPSTCAAAPRHTALEVMCSMTSPTVSSGSPAGFGHGFQVLSDVADVAYKLTSLYDPETRVGDRLGRSRRRDRVAARGPACRNATRPRHSSPRSLTSCRSGAARSLSSTFAQSPADPRGDHHGQEVELEEVEDQGEAAENATTICSPSFASRGSARASPIRSPAPPPAWTRARRRLSRRPRHRRELPQARRRPRGATARRHRRRRRQGGGGEGRREGEGDHGTADDEGDREEREGRRQAHRIHTARSSAKATAETARTTAKKPTAASRSAAAKKAAATRKANAAKRTAAAKQSEGT